MLNGSHILYVSSCSELGFWRQNSSQIPILALPFINSDLGQVTSSIFASTASSRNQQYYYLSVVAIRPPMIPTYWYSHSCVGPPTLYQSCLCDRIQQKGWYIASILGYKRYCGFKDTIPCISSLSLLSLSLFLPLLLLGLPRGSQMPWKKDTQAVCWKAHEGRKRPANNHMSELGSGSSSPRWLQLWPRVWSS